MKGNTAGLYIRRIYVSLMIHTNSFFGFADSPYEKIFSDNFFDVGGVNSTTVFSLKKPKSH